MGRSAHMLFDHGIGPGCMTGVARAHPPVRMREVCQSLDIVDEGSAHVRCFIESICDPNFEAVMGALYGLFATGSLLPGK